MNFMDPLRRMRFCKPTTIFSVTWSSTLQLYIFSDVNVFEKPSRTSWSELRRWDLGRIMIRTRAILWSVKLGTASRNYDTRASNTVTAVKMSTILQNTMKCVVTN